MPHPVDRCQECGEPYYYHNDTFHLFVPERSDDHEPLPPE